MKQIDEPHIENGVYRYYHDLIHIVGIVDGQVVFKSWSRYRGRWCYGLNSLRSMNNCIKIGMLRRGRGKIKKRNNS